MTNYKQTTGCPQIDNFIRDVREDLVRTNQWIKLACALILKTLDNPNIRIDQGKIDKAIEMGERYFFPFFPWQHLVIALVHCYESIYDTEVPVWSRFDLVVGRGAGKNGFISFLIWYFTTPYHGIKGYNIDLVANSEEQATRSFFDVYDMLEMNEQKMSKQFTWTKTQIENTRTNSKIIFNTSNARTKDSKRTGCVVFDEYHEYETYKDITVYQSGLGKVPHARQFFISSAGHVRGGVFDQEMEKNKEILNGERQPNRRLPLLWMLEDKEDANDPANWEISVPSIRYFPTLRIEMESQWIEAQDTPSVMQEFMTKRMGYPVENTDLMVTSWANIVAASRPVPDLRGRECVFGIDYAKTTDFVSAGLLFREGDLYHYIKKTWVCRASADLPRIKAPLDEWSQQDHIEWVDAVEIHPTIVTDWLYRMQSQYNIVGGGIDGYRFTLLSKYLSEIGFTPGAKGNIKLIKGPEMIQIQPVVASAFNQHNIAFGDDPEMRWSINNTKLNSYGRDKDLGNYTYGKQEPKSRKTDSFMAMVHAFGAMEYLSDISAFGFSLPVLTW